jgi:hypothetical protein
VVERQRRPRRWGLRMVRMGKAPESPRMRHGGGLLAKCSSCCGSFWSRNSVPFFLILKMQAGMQHPLESVLYQSLACPKIVREKNYTYTYNRLWIYLRSTIC